MEKTIQIINENQDNFFEFQYYHLLIEKIEKNVDENPDVSIECCKSLIEGVAKTILKKLKIDFKESGRDADNPKDLLNKMINGIPVTIPFDPEFVSKSCALVTRMTEIRNKRGDVSHGKCSPKEIESDNHLAEFVMQITDSTVYYLLKIYFAADLSIFEDIKYEDNPEFNDYLDENYQLDGIVYSKALFDQDIIVYQEQLENYLLEKEN